MKLIIAEKAAIAKYIMRALGGETFWKVQSGEFYESPDYIVSWACGHLFELDPSETPKRKTVQDFFTGAGMTDGFCPDGLSFMPINSNTQPLTYVRQFWALQRLINRNDVNEIIHAGDADSDGEIAIRIILHEAECIKLVTRLFTTDLTPPSILIAFHNRQPLSATDALAMEGFQYMYSHFLNGKRYVLMGRSEKENIALFGGPRDAFEK